MADNFRDIEKLDLKNYATWGVRMQCALVLRDYWGAIEHTEDEAKAPTFQTTNSKAKAAILSCVADHHLSTLADPALTAKAVWDKLKERYQSTSKVMRLQLRSDLNSPVLGAGESCTKYMGQALALQHQMKAAAMSIADEEVICSVLDGLPKDYKTFKTVITSSDKDLSIDGLLEKLLLEEHTLAKENGTAADPNRALSQGCPRLEW